VSAQRHVGFSGRVGLAVYGLAVVIAAGRAILAGVWDRWWWWVLGGVALGAAVALGSGSIPRRRVVFRIGFGSMLIGTWVSVARVARAGAQAPGFQFALVFTLVGAPAVVHALVAGPDSKAEWPGGIAVLTVIVLWMGSLVAFLWFAVLAIRPYSRPYLFWSSALALGILALLGAIALAVWRAAGRDRGDGCGGQRPPWQGINGGGG
jgi:hypothetical protein